MVDTDCTDRDGTLCFSWSKMWTIDEQQTKARIKMTHLCFEDFLEALCRLAVLKALPTMDELAEAECANAGEFLLRQQSGSPERHSQFLQTRRTPWGHLPLLEVGTLVIGHELAILSFIGRQSCKMGGAGSAEFAVSQQLMSQAEDIYQKIQK